MGINKGRRWLVVAAIFVLALITYIDRAAISSAKGPMAAELALSDQAMGAAFSAFALGYALAQVPAGWMADRFGPRIALSSMVALWSLFTALTGTTSRFASLLAVRFLFGVAEAGAFPGAARAFYNWLPAGERGVANGLLFCGALMGGGIAFPICAWLLAAHSWRWMFYLLAIPGLVWAAAWLVWFRDHPAKPVSVEAAARGPAPSLAQTFRSVPMVAVLTQYFAQNFTLFVGMTWMHPYLKERFQLTPAEAAGYAMLPLLCGSASNFASGFLVDYLYRTGRRAWSRRLPAMSGFLLGAVGVFSVSLAGSPLAAVAGFAVAVFGVEMSISPSWAYCLDIGGRNSATLSGAMNMSGNIGAVVSASAFPYLRQLTGSAGTYFCLAALLNVAGIACWLRMKPRKDETND